MKSKRRWFFCVGTSNVLLNVSHVPVKGVEGDARGRFFRYLKELQGPQCTRAASLHRSHPFDSLFVLEKGLCETAAMSVQVVAAKMAEVELKDVPTGKDMPAGSPMTPTSEGKHLARSDPHEAGSSAAASPTGELSAKAGEGSLCLLTPNPAKMPQASAMKRTDPQQNGGEAFVNRDGTVAEAPRMKKVSWTSVSLNGCHVLGVSGPALSTSPQWTLAGKARIVWRC